MDDEARVIEEHRTLRRARLLNMVYEDTSSINIKLYPDILTIKELYDLKAVPIFADTHNIKFGITNTTSQNTMTDLKQRFADQNVRFVMISDMGYSELMKRYDPPKQVVYKDISLTNVSQITAVSQSLNEVRADDMLAFIVKQAYFLKASDIHLESQYESVRIRFRVDGVLHPVANLSHDKYKQLLSSLAIVANVSTRSEDSQTGHINKQYKLADGSEVTVNLRVETVPAIYGMDIVLRLFNLDPEKLTLDSINLNQKERQIIDDIIRHPSGLVLMVGPTGSGKTTTLYSIINKLNTSERKIITLEDPVEYYIKGITQIPVNSHKEQSGFAEKFRAVLRLDPDVIMVGEIRDQDTAKTALQSALTGHLVLSTYHASSAAAAITRLFDSVGENPLFASAIRLITAQRLVRRLDDDTKQAYEPDQKTLEWIKKVVNSMPPTIDRPVIDGIKLYKSVSSEANPFGYKGQIAVRELLVITHNLQQELKKPANEISSDSIEMIAIAEGMTTMMQDAVLRVLAGDTSLEEILRVVE
jgi:type II secretory ATPase GspE/PulE/Tfp pilus assembly ATPase PilB-like protein